MQPGPVPIASHVGLLRTSHGPADVHLDDEVLRLVVHDGPLARLDRHRRVPVAVGAVLALTGVFLAGTAQVLVLLLAGLALAVGSVGVGRTPATRVVDVPRDAVRPGPVAGGLRPRLVLAGPDGDLRLTGWPWRRRALERLAAALGEQAR
ncbi:hypothetical protein GCM10023340_30510 [Nocardioides marinquilinus]|uniref:Uncharacterized protein n=1 Tax=Nocardioides marinquilinus TaxID=1210400 RepID=A0ABP9PWV2_9ACTN